MKPKPQKTPMGKTARKEKTDRVIRAASPFVGVGLGYMVGLDEGTQCSFSDPMYMWSFKLSLCNLPHLLGISGATFIAAWPFSGSR